jgi:hypothetical protein
MAYNGAGGAESERRCQSNSGLHAFAPIRREVAMS